MVYLLARIWLSTLRPAILNDEKWIREVTSGRPVLICMFHQQFFGIVRFFRPYLYLLPKVLISLSRDGNIGTAVALHSGAQVARGSSSRGGAAAMDDMVAHMEKGGIGVNLVDGPQGPVGIIKPGSIRMAQRASALIVPCYITYDKYWLLGSWDAFMIPKPFSRARVEFADPIKIDPQASDDAFEALRCELETAMAPHLILRS